MFCLTAKAKMPVSLIKGYDYCLLIENVTLTSIRNGLRNRNPNTRNIFVLRE